MSGQMPMGRPEQGNQDRAVASISFQFYLNGQQAWARGEYETYVHTGEVQEEAMLRATDNALVIALETRDAFITKSKEH